MNDCAAHLVDRVLPRANYRQWVVTFPRRVRYHLAADPKLASRASRVVLRTIFGWQRRIARGLRHRPGRARVARVQSPRKADVKTRGTLAPTWTSLRPIATASRSPPRVCVIRAAIACKNQ